MLALAVGGSAKHVPAIEGEVQRTRVAVHDQVRPRESSAVPVISSRAVWRPMRRTVSPIPES